MIPIVQQNTNWKNERKAMPSNRALLTLISAFLIDMSCHGSPAMEHLKVLPHSHPFAVVPEPNTHLQHITAVSGLKLRTEEKMEEMEVSIGTCEKERGCWKVGIKTSLAMLLLNLPIAPPQGLLSLLN